MRCGYALLLMVLFEAALLPLHGAESAKFTSFPGEQKTCPSPNGNFKLRYALLESLSKAQIAAGKSPLRLFLQATRTKNDLPLKVLSTGDNSFSREVRVLWSPNSKAFVLNDYIGSGTIESYLYLTSEPTRPIDIRKALQQRLPDKTPFLANTWLFVYATKWINGDEVEISVESLSQPNHKYSGTKYVWNYKTGQTTELN